MIDVMSTIKHPLLRYFGGKWRSAQNIIGIFPSHKLYVEPFGGAGSILLQKQRSFAEVYNDIDGEIVNVFKVLREEGEELKRLLELTPLSREELGLAFEKTDDRVEMARRTIVKSHFSFGSSGLTKKARGFVGESKSTSAARTWASYISSMHNFIDRLNGVIIENLSYSDVMEKYDDKDTLFYLDPPYLHETREKSNRANYSFEMSAGSHEEMLIKILSIKGMVVISGYDSDLYNDMLSGWRKVSFIARANGNKGTVCRSEILWISPNAEESNGLFGISNDVIESCARTTPAIRADRRENRCADTPA